MQSSTESSAEGTADLHRVTLAVRVICQVRGRLHHLGSDPSRAGRPHTQVVAGQTVDPVNLDPPGTIRHLGLPLLHVGPPASRSSAAPPSARPSAARRSTAPPPTSGSRLKPGGTVTFRIAGEQTHRLGPARRRPGTSGSTPPSASPAHDQARGRLHGDVPEGQHLSVLLPGALRPGHEGRAHRRVGRRPRPTTTAATGAGSNVACHHAKGGGAPPAGKPAIYRAGWGLFAVAALLALLLIALHVRFTPGFNRQKR